jgi:uncharacterized membrane protein
MKKGRLEAFSDGVFAILITILVLQLTVPRGSDLAALYPLMPIFLSYVLSFLYLAIYWNNHHHLLQATDQVDGRILWANLHLLFWLSLVPFITGWVGENPRAAWPAALYGIVLFFAAIAYFILSRLLISLHGQESVLGRAIGSDRKGRISLVVYLVAVPAAFINTWLSYALYLLVAVLWLIPDRRIEKKIGPDAPEQE